MKRTPTLELIVFLKDYARHYCPTPVAKPKILEAATQLREAYESLETMIPEIISLKNQLEKVTKERDSALSVCKELKTYLQSR